MKTPKLKKALWRRIFKWFRVFLLAGVFLALCALVYLNKVGLPDFIKSQLLAQLKSRGLELQFSNIRLHWHRGIVADNINLGRAQLPFGPQLFFDEVQIQLNRRALWRLRFEIDAIALRQGRLCWPLDNASQDHELLSLEDVNAELRFPSSEIWELTRFDARLLDAGVHIAGSMTNASWLKHRPKTAAPEKAAPSQLRALREWVHSARQWHWPRSLSIDVAFFADIKDTSHFSVDITAVAPELNNGPVHIHDLNLKARLQPGIDSNFFQGNWNLDCGLFADDKSRFVKSRLSGKLLWNLSALSLESQECDVDIQQIITPWARANTTSLHLQSSALEDPARMNSVLRLQTALIQSDMGKLKDGQASLEVVHRKPGTKAGSIEETGANRAEMMLSRWLLQPAQYHVVLNEPESIWGKAARLNLDGAASLNPSQAATNANPSWAYWGKLAPFKLDWDLSLSNIQSTNIIVEQLRVAGKWAAPKLQISQVHGELYGGRLDVDAELDIATRRVRSNAQLSFDVHRVSALLNANGQKWLKQYGWEQPPAVQAQAEATLPEWTRSKPDWRKEVLPTLCLNGFIEAQTNSFRGAPASTASLHLSLSNGFWSIPDISVTRPEGPVMLAYQCVTATQDYLWEFNSCIDPKVITPLLRPPELKVLDMFEFTSPPKIAGKVYGRWQALERTGVDIRLVATNFTFRGEQIGGLAANLIYTNRFVKVTDIRLFRGSEKVESSRVEFDVGQSKLSLFDVVSDMDPGPVTRMIGPKTAEAFKPYRFARSPSIRMEGSMIVPGPKDADMRFEVQGGPFSYSKFNMPKVSGSILWQGDVLTITNFSGNFYNGWIQGFLTAELDRDNGSDLSFSLAATNTDLHLLMRDVSSPTNKMEGVLSGVLKVDSAISQDWKSWQGSGNMTLNKGRIWDTPIFGVISSLLNSFSSGLGNTKADEAVGSFIITNSVIYTKDLEIRSPPTRLFYNGTVDFDGNVQARVEATLLDGLPVLGPLVSFIMSPITKRFAYKVTGTLSHPKTEPMLIPKVIFFPLRPIKTLKEIFVPASDSEK